MGAEALFAGVRARRGHFRLESGHHADLWLDLESLCLNPLEVQPLAAQLANRLRKYTVDAVCGPLNEGAFVALMAAGVLGCQFAYAERFVSPGRQDGGSLFPVEYRLPAALHGAVSKKRVAIVNDVISAGSAVRGALADLDRLGAQVVVVGSLLVLGSAFVDHARTRGLPVEALSEQPFNLWLPEDCPLCLAEVPLTHASPS